ncbi:MAG: hypothetical protein IJN44_04425 [Clostridia bacterium]|nr:hypothetical protein [Clostridia bacterium]
MNKKIITVVLVVCLLMSAVNGLAAVNADPEFMSATIALGSQKLVVYSAVLNYEKDSIKVVSAILYRKLGNNWYHVGILPVPTNVDTGYSYGSSIDYSSYISTGTYRVQATFDADGYQITRNSNERTF